MDTTWRRSKRGNFWKPLARGMLVVFRKGRLWGWMHERARPGDKRAPCFGDEPMATPERAMQEAEEHLPNCRGPDTLPHLSSWSGGGDSWARTGRDGTTLAIAKSDRSRFELSIRDAEMRLVERVGSFPTMRSAALRANQIADP
jgi:hypothetical protein